MCNIIENKFSRVEDPADPRRCQAVHKNGQCLYVAMEHSNFCPMHGGNKAGEALRKNIKRQYDLAKWQNRMEEFADHDQVKSLREEIGLLRVMLETIVQQCKDANQLILWSSKIADLVMKVEKLVVSCNRLEANMGLLLDKSAALHLAGQMVEIIGKHITDPDAIDGISNEIALAILNLNGADLDK